ncbi:hypothetical protein LTR16_001149 [Cryomyces antarcticus]|uniref:Uncharacterized protein n=1 Tax=Cryomyces antarcticus TaxID=329879 RepID=A0ABR0M8P5_9PEZI|nr:hypothetical protein LTR60_000556 [Cryomyces antarcticus]KAK5295315.1 hypothetical protein LTR16_001149 [Cryomyces antarcticus]
MTVYECKHVGERVVSSPCAQPANCASATYEEVPHPRCADCQVRESQLGQGGERSNGAIDETHRNGASEDSVSIGSITDMGNASGATATAHNNSGVGNAFLRLTPEDRAPASERDDAGGDDDDDDDNDDDHDDDKREALLDRARDEIIIAQARQLNRNEGDIDEMRKKIAVLREQLHAQNEMQREREREKGVEMEQSKEMKEREGGGIRVSQVGKRISSDAWETVGTGPDLESPVCMQRVWRVRLQCSRPSAVEL